MPGLIIGCFAIFQLTIQCVITRTLYNVTRAILVMVLNANTGTFVLPSMVY